jgi:hypothetical protein
VLDPGLFTNLGSERDWQDVSIPSAGTNQRAIPEHMGKVVGGGSSINATIWARPFKKTSSIGPQRAATPPGAMRTDSRSSGASKTGKGAPIRAYACPWVFPRLEEWKGSRGSRVPRWGLHGWQPGSVSHPISLDTSPSPGSISRCPPLAWAVRRVRCTSMGCLRRCAFSERLHALELAPRHSLSGGPRKSHRLGPIARAQPARALR